MVVIKTKTRKKKDKKTTKMQMCRDKQALCGVPFSSPSLFPPPSFPPSESKNRQTGDKCKMNSSSSGRLDSSPSLFLFNFHHPMHDMLSLFHPFFPLRSPISFQSNPADEVMNSSPKDTQTEPSPPYIHPCPTASRRRGYYTSAPA